MAVPGGAGQDGDEVDELLAEIVGQDVVETAAHGAEDGGDAGGVIGVRDTPEQRH